MTYRSRPRIATTSRRRAPLFRRRFHGNEPRPPIATASKRPGPRFRRRSKPRLASIPALTPRRHLPHRNRLRRPARILRPRRRPPRRARTALPPRSRVESRIASACDREKSGHFRKRGARTTVVSSGPPSPLLGRHAAAFGRPFSLANSSLRSARTINRPRTNDRERNQAFRARTHAGRGPLLRSGTRGLTLAEWEEHPFSGDVGGDVSATSRWASATRVTRHPAAAPQHIRHSPVRDLASSL